MAEIPVVIPGPIKSTEMVNWVSWLDVLVVTINGKPVKDYIFRKDYYFVLGDNRDDSMDSRYWGFVGEDHIVGTASFVWMSKHPEKGWFSGGLRWDRVFSFVE